MQVQICKCPECGAGMELRLGMLECRICGHAMEPPPVEIEEEEDTGHPLRRRESWELPTGKPLPAATVGETPTFRQGLDDMVEREPRRDNPSRELSAEKVFVVVLFLAIGTFNVISAFRGDWPLVVGSSLSWVGVLALEVLRFGLTLLVLYYPFQPLKWCGISVATLGLIHALINIWLTIETRPMFLPEFPIGLYTSMLGINTLLMSCINAVVFVVFVSVLGRDMQKVGS